MTRRRQVTAFISSGSLNNVVNVIQTCDSALWEWRMVSGVWSTGENMGDPSKLEGSA